MENIIGKVEAVSQKFSGGLKINGVWYNGNNKTEALVKKVAKGQEVEIQIDDRKKIHFLKVLGGNAEQPDDSGSSDERPTASANILPMDGQQKKVVVDGITSAYGAIMDSCRAETEKIFGTPARRMADYLEVAKMIATEKHLDLGNETLAQLAIAMFNADFVSSRGQHCNSLFIATDREIRGRGIIL